MDKVINLDDRRPHMKGKMRCTAFIKFIAQYAVFTTAILGQLLDGKVINAQQTHDSQA